MRVILIAVFSLFLVSSCNYNPFIDNNRTTGSLLGAATGAAVGVGTVAAFHGSKPWLWTGGVLGGMIGYYVTTLYFDSAGVRMTGGQVYRVGDMIGINIPTDNLFEENTDEFVDNAEIILDSAVAVLARYPNNNILVSGNTSGFDRAHRELFISEKRAQKVSSFLWAAGINNFKGTTNHLRKLNYVGYGNYFPISSDLTNKGIRQNSRIQIVSYPSTVDLHLDQRHIAVRNIGGFDEDLTVRSRGCQSHTYDSEGHCLRDT